MCDGFPTYWNKGQQRARQHESILPHLVYSSGKGPSWVSNNPLRTLRMVSIYNLWTQRRLDEVLWNDNFDHKKLWLCGTGVGVVVVGGEASLDKSDRSWWASWARRGRCMMIRRCRQWVPPPLNWSQGALTPRPLETSHWSESAAAAAWSLVAFSRWLLSPRSFLSSEALLLHSDLASRSEPVSQNSGLAEQHRSDQPAGGRGGHWP